jgi:quinoprotein glucose dehydrogenase
MVVDQNFLKVKKYFLLIIFFFLFASKGYSNNYKFTKIINLNEPWQKDQVIETDKLSVTLKTKVKI